MLALKNPPFFPKKMPFHALQELQTFPHLPSSSFRYVRDVGIVNTKKLKSKVNAKLEFTLVKQAVGGSAKSFYNPNSKYGGEKHRLQKSSIAFQSFVDDGDDSVASLAEEGADESTLDHPGLDSLEEKMEDLRQEFIEKWCTSRGLKAATSFINKDKRALRRWFKELDYDGSKEVNVAELQDPLLSSGILKTKEQVKRVLQNVDKNKTMGIDFEEFLLALKGNKLADFSKLQRLQDMNNNEHGFEMTTLLSHERRKRLFKSTVQQSQMRTRQFEEAFKRASFNSTKVSKRDREKALQELETLEENHLRTAGFHNQYIEALKDVLEESRAFMEMQDEYDKDQAQALKTHVEAIQKEGRVATKRIASPNNGAAAGEGVLPFSPLSAGKATGGLGSFFNEVLHLDFHSKSHADFDVLLPEDIEEIKKEDEDIVHHHHNHHHNHHHHHHSHLRRGSTHGDVADDTGKGGSPTTLPPIDTALSNDDLDATKTVVVTPGIKSLTTTLAPTATSTLTESAATTAATAATQKATTPSTPHRAVRLKSHLNATIDGIPIVDDAEALFKKTHTIIVPDAQQILRNARIYAPPSYKSNKMRK